MPEAEGGIAGDDNNEFAAGNALLAPPSQQNEQKEVESLRAQVKDLKSKINDMRLKQMSVSRVRDSLRLQD